MALIGIRHNTETATMIGDWYNGEGYGDLYYVSETLYKTQKGSYFLYCEGGDASCYNEICGQNEFCGSEYITAMTSAMARDWAEEHLSVDDVESEFVAYEEA